MIDLLKRGETDQFKEMWTGVVFAYFGALIVLFILGCYAQFKLNKDEEKEKDSENANYYGRIR
jgi:hypothetical protein